MTAPTSPYTTMFEGFRAELDEHYDRRERVIKASRDLTSASKRLIFALQRTRSLARPLPSSVTKAAEPHHGATGAAHDALALELSNSLRAHRYAWQVSPGLQEFVEAATFGHYLRHQTLMSFDEVQKLWTETGEQGQGGEGMLQYSDYVLGVFDLTGEMMRWAVLMVAVWGSAPSRDADEGAPEGLRDVLRDMRDMRAALEALDVPRGTPLASEIGKKTDVMKQSVEKVENATYGLVVRGRERPEGWMPDSGGSAEGRMEVDSY
ncbi:Translin [Lineolata rhizophorae]|uniref:Translin n=1 Tax=Lineolata rhizophorae TaxID=578093 RepID=A0A6A6NQ86_9PEZI|nr:Translin [Lineolata rhizophorae]